MLNESCTNGGGGSHSYNIVIRDTMFADVHHCLVDRTFLLLISALKRLQFKLQRVRNFLFPAPRSDSCNLQNTYDSQVFGNLRENPERDLQMWQKHSHRAQSPPAGINSRFGGQNVTERHIESLNGTWSAAVEAEHLSCVKVRLSAWAGVW